MANQVMTDSRAASEGEKAVIDHVEYDNNDDLKHEGGVPGRVHDIDHGIDPTVLKRLRRRVDLRLIPILSLMYFISLVDRTNLAIARAANNVYMDKELELNVGDRYSLITCIFFVPYILFEIPVSYLTVDRQ
jgi:hypothetical protein